MAKKSKGKQKSRGRKPPVKQKTGTVKKSTQRDISQPITTQRVLSRKRHKPFNQNLNYVEDHRTKDKRNYLTTGQKALTTYGLFKTIRRPSRVIRRTRPITPRIKAPTIRYTVRRQFKDSRRTIVCIRRRIRRSVLFASQKTGKGSGQKLRRFNENSQIKCRR